MRGRWAAVLCLLLFCIGYLVAFVPGVPLPKYYPADHVWSVRGDPGGPSMSWFGRLLFATVIGAAGWHIGRVLDKRRSLTDSYLAAVEYVAWASVVVTLMVSAVRELVKWL